MLLLLLLLSLSATNLESIPHRNKDNKTLLLETEAAVAFRNMAASAAKDGIELIPISAWRSHKHQKRLYKKYGPLRAAPPGQSNHEEGLAVDFAGVQRFVYNKKINTKDLPRVRKVCIKKTNGWTCPTITYWWLSLNAKRFGFYQTVDYEPWHWTFKKSL